MFGTMAIRKQWPIVVLVICGLASIAVLLDRTLVPHEPTYAGKPLSTWLDQLDGLDSDQAQLAIRALGLRAIPFLFQKVRQESSKSHGWYRAEWSHLPNTLERHLPS